MKTLHESLAIREEQLKNLQAQTPARSLSTTYRIFDLNLTQPED
jgi:hypothetical protein